MPDTIPAPRIRKKLIEVSLPLEAINKAAAREKSIRHGHPSTLHLWWARRPLAGCRAVLFAQLVDDPSAWPERFPTAEAQETERKRLHKIIEEMVPWEASNDEAILNKARFEIARSVAWNLGNEPPARDDAGAVLRYLQEKAPPVYDPFCGGGSIPLEAQRLGLRAYGSDLNPVAVLISKALVEIPPKFAGVPPVNPDSRKKLARGGTWQGKGAQGLAEDVRYYGQWMRDETEKRIGYLYPKATLPDGSKATVIAWLWARTVKSPDPRAKGAMAPLVSSFMLSTKEGKKAWVEPVIDANAPDGWRFEVHTGKLAKEDEERLKKGTKTGRGCNFSCVLTSAPINDRHVKTEAVAGCMGTRLMAVVAEGARGRVYLTPSQMQEATARNVTMPDIEAIAQPLAKDPRAIWCTLYGLDTFDKLFTPRQLVALTTFSDLVGEAREKALADARAAGLPDDPTPLHAGGTGAMAYADAIATYLAFAISKLADRGSTICTWFTERDSTRNTFARQSIPMTWDYAELNTLLTGTGTFSGAVDWTAESVAGLIVRSTDFGQSKLASATSEVGHNARLICTDPPYYDNIGYADLSDFFYVWLRRSLSAVWPTLFRRLTTPKDQELIATPYRHGSKEAADSFFMKGMSEALTAIREAAFEDTPLTIYYAFKQSETGKDGIASPGWASFLQATVNAGLGLDGTWPLRTELGNRMIGRGANALASSIVLVCRKRLENAPITTRADFLHALKRELPEAIEKIRAVGVGPVDMQQSIIGPGMGVFTRYAKILEDDDSPMPVKTALALINRVWEEIENELEGNYDSETQVTLAWFAAHGYEAKPSGELITLANAKNITLKELFETRVFRDLHGKVKLTERTDALDGQHQVSDELRTVWGCVQGAARALSAEDGGAEAAAALIEKMGANAEAARSLSYRLFKLATDKSWTSEALAYNQLAEEWPRLEALNAERAKREAEPVQPALI